MSEIQVHKPGFVELSATVAELEARFKQYQQLKEKLLTAEDIVKIGNTDYIRKSGRTKFEVAFNLSTKVLSERKEIDITDPKKYAYHFTVQCIANNGRVIEEVGTCDNTEKSGAAEHIIRSMAKTRATSRAVFEMIGAGDMAAEEAELIPKKTETVYCKCTSGTNLKDMTKNPPVCLTCKHQVKV